MTWLMMATHGDSGDAASPSQDVTINCITQLGVGSVAIIAGHTPSTRSQAAAVVGPNAATKSNC